MGWNMKDEMKTYLLQKSIEALGELGINYTKDEVIAEKSKKLKTEQREHERVWVEFPVTYKVGRCKITGSTVNACGEGMMVESYLSSRSAARVFKILRKKPNYHVELSYEYKGNAHQRTAEVKHFHFDFSGSEPYRFTAGFRIRTIESG
jgi:hypothetical protein